MNVLQYNSVINCMQMSQCQIGTRFQFDPIRSDIIKNDQNFNKEIAKIKCRIVATPMNSYIMRISIMATGFAYAKLLREIPIAWVKNNKPNRMQSMNWQFFSIVSLFKNPNLFNDAFDHTQSTKSNLQQKHTLLLFHSHRTSDTLSKWHFTTTKCAALIS